MRYTKYFLVNSFEGSGEALVLRIGGEMWRKVGVVFDGFAVAPSSLLEWIRNFISEQKGSSESKTQLNIFLKDGNGTFNSQFSKLFCL